MSTVLQNRRLARLPRNKQQMRQVTKRDIDVLTSLYRHRCLTTEQIAEMHFLHRSDNPSRINLQAPIVARRRIRKMYDAGLVDRFFVDAGTNNGSSQGHILLDTKGAQLVAASLGCKVDDLNWRTEMNLARLPYLQHMVAVNDFYLYVLRRAREMGHVVSDYRVEHMTRYEFRHDGRRFVVNPDAYGQYLTPDAGIHFFVEIDRGTMSPAAFQRKQGRYAAFYASDEYRTHFQTFPLVLTVTTTWERAVELRNVIYDVDQTDIRWLFTCDDLACENVLGEIWLGRDVSPAGIMSTM